MNMQHTHEPGRDHRIRNQVGQLLDQTQSFRHLDGATQQALKDSLARITGYLAEQPMGSPALAAQLAPTDLQRRLAPQGGQPVSPAQPVGAVPAQGTPAGSSSGQSATARVGDVARATLNAIDFPQFVASLIQGTFKAIVDSSIQQMEAYAELLKNVATTVDRFMADNISDGVAKDFLADQHEGFLIRDTAGGRPRLRVNPDQPADGEMPSFFKDLGFESPDQIDDQAMEEVVVPATRRSMAERRQQTLATMVLMGINRVVVDDGEIQAKLQFHIDARETTNLRFDQQKTTTGNISKGGNSPFTANGIMVNTTSLNAQSDINVRTDLTGQVKVKFRSETFPLERFADSAAIQLINQNARVPQAASAPTAAAAPPAPAPVPTAPAPAATTPPAAPKPATGTPARPPAPATQSLDAQSSSAGVDPWAPRSGALRSGG